MKLSSRQNEIIRIISSSEEYTTTEAIATMLNLSTRTIKRELEEIGMFLETIGVPFERKSGKGIKIFNGESTSQLIESILEKKTIPVFSASKRVIILLLTLLFSDEALKRFTLASVLGTSELTVSSDLVKCEEVLGEKGITLVRKQGYGIYVVGSEERRRVAIFEIIEEATKGFSLLEVPSKTIEQFVSRRELEEIAKTLEECNKSAKIYESDRSRDNLALHLLIQKKRVEASNKITLEKQCTSEEAVEFSSDILYELGERYNISYSTGEIHFFADILCLTQGVAFVESQSETALFVARKLAQKLESGFGILVDAENEFFTSLIRHLVLTVNRSEKKIDVLNPILSEIQITYPDIYNMVEQACEEINAEQGLHFTKDEIGYLTLHMCVIALDGTSSRREKCRAIVVCPSGLVTSRLLSINVKRAFPNIEIAETSAVIDVEKITTENQDINMVISTVEVRSGKLPCAVVSPFITPADKDVIEKCMKNISKVEILREVQKIEKDMATSVVEKMQVKDTIADLISDMLFIEEFEVENSEVVIEKIASYYCESQTSKSEIIKNILAREEIGSTIMADGETMLMHAKTSGVYKACFGVLRFKHELQLEKPQSSVKYAVVMLAPQNSKQCTKVLSEISQMLILDESFYQCIKNSSRNEIKNRVKEVLYNYYYDNFKE